MIKLVPRIRTLLLVAILTITAATLTTAISPNGEAQTPQRIAVIGDSMSAYCCQPAGEAVGPGDLWTENVDGMLDNADVRTYSVPGATATRHLYQYPEVTAPIEDWQPNLVIFALGGNDYYIARNLDYYGWWLYLLAERIREMVPAAQFMYLHYQDVGFYRPFGPDYQTCDVQGYCEANHRADPRPTWAQYGERMRFIATEPTAAQGIYVDIAGRLQQRRFLWARPSGDDWHFTYAGHAKLSIFMMPHIQAALSLP